MLPSWKKSDLCLPMRWTGRGMKELSGGWRRSTSGWGVAHTDAHTFVKRCWIVHLNYLHFTVYKFSTQWKERNRDLPPTYRLWQWHSIHRVTLFLQYACCHSIIITKFPFTPKVLWFTEQTYGHSEELVPKERQRQWDAPVALKQERSSPDPRWTLDWTGRGGGLDFFEQGSVWGTWISLVSYPLLQGPRTRKSEARVKNNGTKRDVKLAPEQQGHRPGSWAVAGQRGQGAQGKIRGQDSGGQLGRLSEDTGGQSQVQRMGKEWRMCLALSGGDIPSSRESRTCEVTPETQTRGQKETQQKHETQLAEPRSQSLPGGASQDSRVPRSWLVYELLSKGKCLQSSRKNYISCIVTWFK